MSKAERTETTRELVVYSCQCVEHGPELQTFNEDDIQAAGGFTESKRDCGGAAIGLPA
jgi:hypothetical protein